MTWTGLPYQAPEHAAAATEARRSELEHVRSSWQGRLSAAAQACTPALRSAKATLIVLFCPCDDMQPEILISSIQTMTVTACLTGSSA